jgi:hypothetical protein
MNKKTKTINVLPYGDCILISVSNLPDNAIHLGLFNTQYGPHNPSNRQVDVYFAYNEKGQGQHFAVK